MININDKRCSICKGLLTHYDKVERYIKTAYGYKRKIILNRSKCTKCGKIHRVMPVFVLPYKHYRKDIILNVIRGFITPDTIGYEDYPCEMTMIRWQKEKSLL